MKYGNIDGSGIAEIRNFNFQNLQSAPTTNLKKGRFYFSTTDNTLYVYNGTQWLNALAQGTTYTFSDGLVLDGSTVSVDFDEVATASQGAKADSALQSGDNISLLNNNAGFISGITGAMVTTALGYTPYNSSNPSGYQANVIESIKVNNVVQTITAKTVNITVPTTASDVDALPDTTKYGASIDLSLNTTDYKLTLTLKDQDGTTLNTKTVDFPIESVVVGGSYDSTNKKIVLTLQNGNTIDVPVGDLIAGLQTEITSSNKLSSDLVDDTNNAHKFATASQLQQIATNQTNIGTINTTLSGYGNIVTHNVSEFATASQGTKADTAMQRYTVNNSAITVSSSGVGAFVVTHNLNTTNPIVNVYEVATGEKVMYDVVVTSANVVTINILSANNIPADTFKAVVIG